MIPDGLPAPWHPRPTVWAGGLIGLGFGENSDLMLVVTHDGRGVIDCLTGERCARDADPNFLFDEDRRVVIGVGPLASQEIVISGVIYGGFLPVTTQDGWTLKGQLTNRSGDVVSLLPPPAEAGLCEPFDFTDFVPEIRVFGFSPTGRTFVIGTGAEVFVFGR